MDERMDGWVDGTVHCEDTNHVGCEVERLRRPRPRHFFATSPGWNVETTKPRRPSGREVGSPGLYLLVQSKGSFVIVNDHFYKVDRSWPLDIYSN